jgi:hypothetical protein
MPTHAYHSVHHATRGGGYDWMLLLVDIGTLLWMVAYILAIVQGFRQKTYGIPMIAISLNFTWEVLAAFSWQEPVVIWRIGDILWMMIDGVIVYQLFRFGRARQTVPEVQNGYYPILIALFLIAIVGQYTFTMYFRDNLGFEDAYVISIVMGGLFINLFFSRRDAGNLAYGVAWTKMLGTALTSLALYFILPRFYPDERTYGFMYFAYVLCFVLDSTYIVLIARARRTATVAPARAVPTALAA